MIDDEALWSLAMAMMRKAPKDEAQWPVERVDAFIRDGQAVGIDMSREIADRMHALAHQGWKGPERRIETLATAQPSSGMP